MPFKSFFSYRIIFIFPTINNQELIFKLFSCWENRICLTGKLLTLKSLNEKCNHLLEYDWKLFWLSCEMKLRINQWMINKNCLLMILSTNINNLNSNPLSSTRTPRFHALTTNKTIKIIKQLNYYRQFAGKALYGYLKMIRLINFIIKLHFLLLSGTTHLTK